jgi:hypothetical protein
MAEQAFLSESGGSQAASATNRRIEVRYATQVPASCCDLFGESSQNNDWMAATVRDISRSGIGLVIPQRSALQEMRHGSDRLCSG